MNDQQLTSPASTTLLTRLRQTLPQHRWLTITASAATLTIAAIIAFLALQPPYRAPNPVLPISSHSATIASPSATPTASPSATPSPTLTATPIPSTTQQSSHLKTFSPNDFVNLYYSLNLPNTTKLTTPPAITGDAAADAHMAAIAESQGYQLQRVANGGLVSVDGQQLQPAAAAGWRQLKANAAADGISLGLISGYRSPDYQKQLFLGSLHDESVARVGRDYTNQELAAGTGDDAIKAVLATRSIPGFSKHHTGYVMDITDAGSHQDFTNFRSTAGYQWISANNYEQAKRAGFIPSYPAGATNMGPNPEAWEFIFVGTQYLTQ